MHRIARILATLAFCSRVASCGAAEPSGEIATTQGAVTTGVCNAGHPVRTVDVTFVGGTCVRYFLDATGGPWYFQNQTQVSSVFAAQESAAWVCDVASPLGFGMSTDAPCWNGSATNNFLRVRGAPVGSFAPYTASTYPYAINVYGPLSRSMGSFVGLSFVLSRGTLPGQPACPYTTTMTTTDDPTHWHQCVGSRSNSGLQDWYSNNDPVDGNFCCNTSALWPYGSTGRPCTDHVYGSGDYATENYGGCPVY